MADEVKNADLNPQVPTSNIQSDLNTVSALPSHVTDILNETNSGISDIVRIKELERNETGLFSGILNGVYNRFNNILGIDINPEVFKEMTDTLNKHRHLLEMKSADNYNSEIKEAA